jgi:N-dimethylarginine dimethylaminohydrolase
MKPNARFLMCRPEHFAVSYAINPWMDPASWASDERAHADASRREWNTLHRLLGELGAAIELVPAAAGVPDLVFTANGAVVMDRQVLLARFRHPERQREEAHFEAAFRSLQAHGIVDGIRKLPEHVVLEGAGDCVWDRTRGLFWIGYGQRSDAAARHAVEDMFGRETTALELADPRFYHMDTALSALPRGEVMYVPCAFTAAGRSLIAERVPRAQRIEIGVEDASRLAANAVSIGDDLVMSGCGERLRSELAERGYRVLETPLSSFLRSGGSAFCLTLRLDLASVPAGAAEHAAAA